MTKAPLAFGLWPLAFGGGWMHLWPLAEDEGTFGLWRMMKHRRFKSALVWCCSIRHFVNEARSTLFVSVSSWNAWTSSCLFVAMYSLLWFGNEHTEQGGYSLQRGWVINGVPFRYMMECFVDLLQHRQLDTVDHRPKKPVYCRTWRHHVGKIIRRNGNPAFDQVGSSCKLRVAIKPPMEYPGKIQLGGGGWRGWSRWLVHHCFYREWQILFSGKSLIFFYLGMIICTNNTWGIKKNTF